MSHIAVTGGNRQRRQALPADQWGRAQPKVPQIGLHTSESPAGQPLLALWGFLDTRTTDGSYHGGADVHGARSQYAPWSWYTWHAPAINPFACGLSANCRADEWDRISPAWRTNLIKGLAWLAHQYSRWCVSQGLGPVPPRRITAAQARAKMPGFIYHGDLQSDRTDPTGPRNIFPWEAFLAEFNRLEAQGNLNTLIGELMSTPREIWMERDGNDFVHTDPQTKSRILGRTHQTVARLVRILTTADQSSSYAERIGAQQWEVIASPGEEDKPRSTAIAGKDYKPVSWRLAVQRIYRFAYWGWARTVRIDDTTQKILEAVKALAEAERKADRAFIADAVKHALEEHDKRQVEVSVRIADRSNDDTDDVTPAMVDAALTGNDETKED